MKFLLQILIICLIIPASKGVFAQEIAGNAQVYKVISIELKAGIETLIPLDKNYSAVLIDIDHGPVDLRLRQSDRSIVFIAEPYTPSLELPAQFIFLNSLDSFIRLTATKNTTVQIHLYDAGHDINIQGNKTKRSNFCNKPQTISQEVWRDGLPDPVQGRTVTDVRHVIVHHSAGSNQITNYTTAVRSIYLLHTQTNGWDDIGYNFLIAPDGVLYSGRDALDAGDEDNILGAHYCSKNSGTLGVCLIGSYNNTGISTSMYNSLIHLVTWKLYKESLNPYDAYAHPIIQSPNLGVIAFHRDGCATVCPGDSIVAIEGVIKSDVQWELNICNGISSIHPMIRNKTFKVFPNPGNGVFHYEGPEEIESIILTDILGRKLDFEHSVSGQNIRCMDGQGIYIMRYKLKNGLHGSTVLINTN